MKLVKTYGKRDRETPIIGFDKWELDAPDERLAETLGELLVKEVIARG